MISYYCNINGFAGYKYTMARKYKSYFLNGILVLSSIVVALLIGEIIIRIFIVTPVEYVVKNPLVGHKYRPNANINRRDSESGNIINLSINSDGYRDREHKLEKPAGFARIAVLGDSFVAGRAVDQKNLFTALLETKLNRDRKRLKFEVFNFGVSGYGTGQEYLVLKEYALKYSPDLVVQFFFVGNDVWDNSNELSNSRPVYFELDDQGKLRLRPFSRRRQKALNWLNKHSRLYLWQKGAVDKLVHYLLYSFIPKYFFSKSASANVITELSVDPKWYIYSAHYPEKWERAWILTKKLILKMKQECHDHGLKYLLVSIPRAHQTYDDYWESASRGYEAITGSKWDRTKPERILESFSEKNNIDYLSLLPLFQQEYKRSGKRVNFRRGHFSEYGHSVVADILFAKISEFFLE